MLIIVCHVHRGCGLCLKEKCCVMFIGEVVCHVDRRGCVSCSKERLCVMFIGEVVCHIYRRGPVVPCEVVCHIHKSAGHCGRVMTT